LRVAQWHKAVQGGSTKQNPRHTAAPDLLARDFTAVAPNTKWVADLTRILTGEGVLWLASVRDAFSNKVIGWDSGARATTELVGSALDYAILSRDVREASSSYLGILWRCRCEWIGWRKILADCVFQAAAAVMIWFQTAKRLVISVRHSGALIR
jgi:hypothetical protein